MEYSIKMEQNYLGLPIQTEQAEELLEIFRGDEKIFEFRIPVCKNPEQVRYDYYSYLDVKQFRDCELTLKGNFDESFFAHVCQSENNEREPIIRPLIHFAAERGWLNDPNGLVYHNGTYHLYFQYNPMNTQWQNMTWGHAESKDFLHFEQKDNVLYPDENGTMYSGCGLVNEKGMLGLPDDALLFYYSASGDINEWSRGKWFTQRIAYSLDEGRTLVKMPEEAVGVMERDTRDPKVFWHEETQAYIMVLWIKGFEFGFLRSVNLKDWELTSTIELERAWECPDMFCLDCGGEKVWVFTSADGFYYFGRFDGYKFETDGVRHNMYLTGLPYAAQTYSGLGDRVVSIPWLRTLNAGKLFTGMMGIPRELGLTKRGDRMMLTMLPVKEYEAAKQQIAEFSWGETEISVQLTEEAALEIELHPQEIERLKVRFFGEELVICGNEMCYKDKKTVFPEKMEDIHMIVDRGVIEIHAGGGTENVYYETDCYELKGSVSVQGCKGAGKLYIIK